MRNTYCVLTLGVLSGLSTACGGLDVEGTYETSAKWDLSEPFIARDGIGGGVSDFMIDGIVESVVPGFLEDEAASLVSGLIRQPIAGAINSQLPPELQPDGRVLTGLSGALKDVDVQTRWDIDGGFEGTETLTQLSFPRAGQAPYVLDATNFLENVQVAGKIEGDDDGDDRYKVKDYELEIRFGDLIINLTEGLLGENADALVTRSRDAFICSQVVDAIASNGSLGFTVAGRDFNISASDLLDLCNKAKGDLNNYVFGLARINGGVGLGGPVTVVDADGDGVVDMITSDVEYEGRITLIPGPFEPKFAVELTAERQ